jgi:hypothetical protein
LGVPATAHDAILRLLGPGPADADACQFNATVRLAATVGLRDLNQLADDALLASSLA